MDGTYSRRLSPNVFTRSGVSRETSSPQKASIKAPKPLSGLSSAQDTGAPTKWALNPDDLITTLFDSADSSDIRLSSDQVAYVRHGFIQTIPNRCAFFADLWNDTLSNPEVTSLFNHAAESPTDAQAFIQELRELGHDVLNTTVDTLDKLAATPIEYSPKTALGHRLQTIISDLLTAALNELQRSLNNTYIDTLRSASQQQSGSRGELKKGEFNRAVALFKQSPDMAPDLSKVITLPTQTHSIEVFGRTMLTQFKSGLQTHSFSIPASVAYAASPPSNSRTISSTDFSPDSSTDSSTDVSDTDSSKTPTVDETKTAIINHADATADTVHSTHTESPAPFDPPSNPQPQAHAPLKAIPHDAPISLVEETEIPPDDTLLHPSIVSSVFPHSVPHFGNEVSPEADVLASLDHLQDAISHFSPITPAVPTPTIPTPTIPTPTIPTPTIPTPTMPTPTIPTPTIPTPTIPTPEIPPRVPTGFPPEQAPILHVVEDPSIHYPPVDLPPVDLPVYPPEFPVAPHVEPDVPPLVPQHVRLLSRIAIAKTGVALLQISRDTLEFLKQQGNDILNGFRQNPGLRSQLSVDEVRQMVPIYAGSKSTDQFHHNAEAVTAIRNLVQKETTQRSIQKMFPKNRLRFDDETALRPFVQQWINRELKKLSNAQIRAVIIGLVGDKALY